MATPPISLYGHLWWVRKSTCPAPPYSFSILIIWREKIGREYFFSSVDLSWRLDIPSPKIVINLSWTYEKIHCKGEPYRFMRSIATDKKSLLLNINGWQFKAKKGWICNTPCIPNSMIQTF